MTINDRAFAYAQVGYVLVVLLALILMPGAHVITTLIAMVGVWCVVSGVYQAAPWRNREGWWTLLIAATILAVGIIANVHCFTVKAGATTELPLLNNPDSYRFHYNARVYNNIRYWPCYLPHNPYQAVRITPWNCNAYHLYGNKSIHPWGNQSKPYFQAP